MGRSIYHTEAELYDTPGTFNEYRCEVDGQR